MVIWPPLEIHAKLHFIQKLLDKDSLFSLRHVKLQKKGGCSFLFDMNVSGYFCI